MKKKLAPLLLASTLILTILFASCKKNDSIQDLASHETGDTIVLFNRSSTKPFILSNKTAKLSNKSTNGVQLNDLPGVLDFRYYLGRAYSLSSGEFGTGEGVKFPIFDIDKLIADNPDYFLSKQLGASEAKRFSFADFSNYQNKSNYSTSVSGGFSLSLGLFSIGAKHKFDNSYSMDFVNDNKRVWGELNVTVKDASHELLISANTIKKIKENYIKPSFIDELYNSSASEIVNNYGGFVVTGLITGGKANALFTGNYTSTSTTEVRESSMDNSINAAFTFTPKSDKSSADIGIGNKNGSTIAKSFNISDFKGTVKTYGGDYGFGSFTTPKSIDDIAIDLGPWSTSLNDKTKHVMVAFTDNGLHPIGDFITPENMRENILKVVDLKQPAKALREPRIEARWSRIHNVYGLVTVVLRTRFGDDLIISDTRTTLQYGKLDDMLNFAKQEAQKKLPFYKVKVVATSTPSQDNSEDPFFNVNAYYSTSIVNIDEANMKKFYDTKNSMLYLLSEAQGRKFAYAVHYDYLLDTYGIRDWVNAMAPKTITLDDLNTYAIVAL
jgi:hypothetical protein